MVAGAPRAGGGCRRGWLGLAVRRWPRRAGSGLVIIPIAFATVLLLAIWLVFFSRLPWGRRRWAIGAVLAIVAITAATTRIRGVTGDSVPILEWRWSSRLPPPLPEQPLRETPRSDPDVPNPAPKPPVPESPFWDRSRGGSAD